MNKDTRDVLMTYDKEFLISMLFEARGICDDLRDDKDTLLQALNFTLTLVENIYKPYTPVEKGQDLSFYHTLSYEEEVKLMDKIKIARALFNSTKKWEF